MDLPDIYIYILLWYAHQKTAQVSENHTVLGVIRYLCNALHNIITYSS